MKKVRILLIFNNLAVFNLGGSSTFHYGGGFGIGSKNRLFNRLRMEYPDSIPNLTIRRQFTQRHKLLVSASESPSHRPWMSESLFSHGLQAFRGMPECSCKQVLHGQEITLNMHPRGDTYHLP